MMHKNRIDRRQFLSHSAAAAGSAFALTTFASASQEAREHNNPLNVGVIGCGGRGTGAAINCIQASQRVRIVALADLFEDRLKSSREYLAQYDEQRSTVADNRCYTGFESYQRLLDDGDDIDIAILATPPHFRPIHFEAAVNAGKHCFIEKPVATDPTGVRRMLKAAEQAEQKQLSVAAGTQRRHERSYIEAMQRVHDGAIGNIVAARCYWNQGGLWHNGRQPDWSDMEWQLRNWLYFCWLSGDHIVEQHVHNLDIVNWALGSHPVRAHGMGGRSSRTDSKFGNAFDHFAIDYEYPGGIHCMSMCRQIDHCAGRVEEVLCGARGTLQTSPGRAVINSESPWRVEGENNNPYVQEHINLIASIDGTGEYLNEARRVTESTLTAIMGRLSAYTGQEVTWEQALNSPLDLSPPEYAFTSLDVRPVAVPGQTPLLVNDRSGEVAQ